MPLKILFIGGTGNISTACTRRAIALGHNVWHINRGNRSNLLIEGVKTLAVDINDFAGVQKVLAGHKFDVVVNFIAFNALDIERDHQLFRDITQQYIFISSTSAYQKPLLNPIVREDTPLANPYWEYSRLKIEAENKLFDLYRNQQFPALAVRPSLTYEYVIPVPIGGWTEFTIIERIRAGKPIVVHGDGSSLWTITHSSDFAKGLCGLFGNPNTIGHAFHITSDEILTWDQIYTSIARAAGCEPNIVHIASDFICNAAEAFGHRSLRGTLLGDKSVSVIFDNSKIKRFVPGFGAEITFAQGIANTIRWFEQDPARCKPNNDSNAFLDFLINSYTSLKL